MASVAQGWRLQSWPTGGAFPNRLVGQPNCFGIQPTAWPVSLATTIRLARYSFATACRLPGWPTIDPWHFIHAAGNNKIRCTM
jgi:hypothetical protein